jgi:tRNA-modifying protein YgfZ
MINNLETTYLTKLTHLGLLRLEGSLAKSMLQGQLTCHMEQADSEHSLFAAHCNPQGRILSLFRLFFYQGAYYLQMPNEILESTIHALQKYAPFFKVKIVDASLELHKFSLAGPLAVSLLTKKIGNLPQEIDTMLTYPNFVVVKLPGVHAHFEVIGETQAVYDLQAELLAYASLGDENTWKYLNIAAGIPSLYSATVAKLLPHEINLQTLNGIHFNKGCYTGQEIIARMQYRGTLKKHMYRGQVQSDVKIQVGSDVFAKEACGIIVDSCHLATNMQQMLIVIDKQIVAKQSLFLDATQNFPIEILTLPYDVKQA